MLNTPWEMKSAKSSQHCLIKLSAMVEIHYICTGQPLVNILYRRSCKPHMNFSFLQSWPPLALCEATGVGWWRGRKAAGLGVTGAAGAVQVWPICSHILCVPSRPALIWPPTTRTLRWRAAAAGAWPRGSACQGAPSSYCYLVSRSPAAFSLAQGLGANQKLSRKESSG